VNKTIIITGIPGTGKTTVCDAVEKLAKQAGKKVDVINYGTVMVNILQKYKKMSRDAMRKADIPFQRKLQRETAEAVSEKIAQLEGTAIVDTYMSIKTPEGYLPGLPYYVLKLLKPEMFVLVEAQPREISSRRMRDATRKRDEATKEAVKEELLFSRLMAGACAVFTGSPIKTVINAEGKQEEAAKNVLKTLGQV
jgi:adenylate kinase